MVQLSLAGAAAWLTESTSEEVLHHNVEISYATSRTR
jgi:ferritin